MLLDRMGVQEMFQLKNDRLLRALRLEPVDRTPIWIMRQAGRYLPEYRKVRTLAGSFMNLCQTPELACEVTLQPLRRYALDAAIIFSDILTIPHAMGLGLTFIEGKGPLFKHPLQSAKAIHDLPSLDLCELDYVYQAISLVKKALDGSVPLIGFCGSPWTLAAYAVQGESVPQFPIVQKMIDKEPTLLHNLLSKLAKAITLHLSAQMRAGADVVMVFDTWGGLLSDSAYCEFSIPYLEQIFSSLKRYNNNVPVILFTKGGRRWLEKMAHSGCDALGVDWEVSLQEARERVGKQVALQGNLNPSFLLKEPKTIRRAAMEVMDSFGQGSGHIFNLGHGITPEVPPEQVTVLVETVHDYSKRYHSKNEAGNLNEG